MFPDRAAASGGLGRALTQWGKLDEALEMFKKQEELGPGRLEPFSNRYDVYILREAWDDAEAAATSSVPRTTPLRFGKVTCFWPH